MSKLPEQVDPLSFILFLPFYFINLVVSILPPPPQFPTATQLTTSSPNKTYSNIEEWEIKEMADGTVKMVIHRKAQKA